MPCDQTGKTKQNKQTKNKRSKSCQIHYGNMQEISFLHFPSHLPPHHPPISPAVQDGHAWWRLSRENWPGPMAPAYWWENRLLGQSDRSPAGYGTPRQSTAGNRSRWSAWSFSSRVPPDSQGLQHTVNREKTMNEQHDHSSLNTQKNFLYRTDQTVWQIKRKQINYILHTAPPQTKILIACCNVKKIIIF